LWLHSLKVAQLLRSAACLHTNQSRSYLNHLVKYTMMSDGNLTVYSHTSLSTYTYALSSHHCPTLPLCSIHKWHH